MPSNVDPLAAYLETLIARADALLASLRAEDCEVAHWDECEGVREALVDAEYALDRARASM